MLFVAFHNNLLDSCPCITGSPWQRMNQHLGNETGDPILADRLISASISLARHVAISWKGVFGNGLLPVRYGSAQTLES